MGSFVRNRAEHAWRSHRAWFVLLTFTLLGLVADLGSKSAAFRFVAGGTVTVKRNEVLAADNLTALIPFHQPMVVVPRVLEFTLVLNPGAVFGIGAGKRWFFIVFTGVAIGFAVWVFATWTRRRDHVSHGAIGLLLSGALGNVYDRIVFGCVRDFIHPLPRMKLPFGWSYPWGGSDLWPYVSNVADLFLLVGVGVLVWKSLRGNAARHTTPADQAEAA